MKTRFLTKIFGLLISTFSGAVSFAQLEVPPQLEWRRLHTSHFEVVYNAKQQDLGRLYAEKLEMAYQALKPYFSSMPIKTTVVINDKTDITNGYATRIPYPHIMIYPVLPGPEESLADTGDWAFELLVHEYTHILNFEPANGMVRPFRSIFGTVIAPNILLPQWWKEGLAVEMETRLSHNGRLRSYFQDSVIRSLYLNNELSSFTIDQANEALPSWPKGMRPYLFGSLFWSQVLEEHGEKVISQLNEAHGGEIPYILNSPAQPILKKDYVSQYEAAIEQTGQRVEKQLQILRSKSFTHVTIPQNHFTSVSAPAISPDGKKIALVTEDDANLRSIKIILKENAQQSFLDSHSAATVEKFNEALPAAPAQDNPGSGSIQRLSWFPDSERLIYDKIDYVNRRERYSDLHIYSLKEKRNKRLTKGLRLREPAVSEDGKKVTFVKLEGGKTALGILDVSSPEKVEVLVTPSIQERISYPSFWNAEEILYSLRKETGEESLEIYNISTKSSRTLFPEYQPVRFARKTPAGLLFTSGVSGVLNLYLASADLKTIKPASHTDTALMTADLDPLNQEIYATKVTPQGLRAVRILGKDWQNSPVPPKVEGLFADRYRNPAQEKVLWQKVAQEEMQKSSEEEYTALGYLAPRYWFPFIFTSSSDEGVVISAQTSGFDPLKKHSYTLFGSWDTGLQAGTVEGTYLNQVTALPMGFAAFNRSSYLGNVSNRIEDKGGLLFALPDMFWLSKYSSLQTGWTYIQRESDISSVKRTGPFATLRYGTASQSGAQISPESGFAVYLGAEHYIEQQDYLSHSQFAAGFVGYFSKWLPSHHAIAFRADAIYTPELISPIYGSSTVGAGASTDSSLQLHILRGYSRGQLFGRNLASFNLEYRFPVHEMNYGSGTTPLFFKRLSGALTADTAAADGRFANDKDNRYEFTTMHDYYSSAGIELRLENTIGYVLPLNIIFGIYGAFNTPEGLQPALGLGIQVPGF